LQKSKATELPEHFCSLIWNCLGLVVQFGWPMGSGTHHFCLFVFCVLFCCCWKALISCN